MPRYPRSTGAVPVKNRSGKRHSPRREVGVGARRRSRTLGFSLVQIGVLVVCMIIILVMITGPLGSYFQQRGEIERLTAQVSQKKQEKAVLLDKLQKYHSDAYVKEQARERLGVINPGETAFRIIAPPPERKSLGPVTPDGTPTAQLGAWWDVLWDSISRPERAPILPPQEKPIPSGKPAGNSTSGPVQPPAPAMKAHIDGLKGQGNMPASHAPATPSH